MTLKFRNVPSKFDKILEVEKSTEIRISSHKLLHKHPHSQNKLCLNSFMNSMAKDKMWKMKPTLCLRHCCWPMKFPQ